MISLMTLLKRFHPDYSPMQQEAPAEKPATPEYKTEVIEPKPVPVVPPVPPKNSKVEICIHFKDGTNRGFNQIHSPDKETGHIKAFYGFFDWFMRRTTPSYYFPHRNGGMIFIRSEIKLVEFTKNETNDPVI